MEEELDGRRLKYGFLHNHARLLRRLTTSSILGHVFGQGIVTSVERDKISMQLAEDSKTDMLLDIVHRQGVANPSIYVAFFNLLSDEDVTSGQNLKNVLNVIKADAQSEDVLKKFKYEGRLMEENDKAILLKFKATIVKTLIVENILPDLVSSGIVSSSNKMKIMSEKLLDRQVEVLLEVVWERGSPGLDRLVEVLESSDKYETLGSQLREARERHGPLPDGKPVFNQYPVEEVLKRGYVPPRQGVYVERKKLLEEVRATLRQLKNSEGWVFISGMPGFGKTVLAAEAVRDANLLEEVFPGGVHWLTLGKLTDRRGEVDGAKLLSKLQTLILRLDDSNSNPQLPSVEAAKNYLQKVMEEQQPRSLLILDDVWSQAVLNAFSVRCRVLVTTRVLGLVSPVMVQNVHQVSVMQGFSDQEGKQLLALWLGMKAEEISSYANKVLDYCRGSPMAIALIGGMLRKNRTERKWKVIAEKLESSHLYLVTKINDWNYEHPTLKVSIELTTESLSEEIQRGEYFHKLAVLDYDFPVSLLALNTIWDLDEWTTEKHMDDITSYSLARVDHMSEDCDCPYYSIHDIILDYLKNSIPLVKQREYHREVVENYKKKSGDGALSELEDDGYVFKKLLAHIIGAEEYELLGSLLTNLLWIVSCVLFGDANELLVYYKEWRPRVPQDFQADMKKFELFLTGHMYVLANSPKREVILQLALLQPNESEIYNQAFAATRGEKKSLFFTWSNKDSDPEKYALKLKLHDEGVSHCQFTADEEKVISSAGMEVKVWDPSTGMVMSTFRNHLDTVTCCAISSNGTRAVSSSEDNTVKVWETRTLQLICNFTRHKYGVQCCAFSPDEKFVISADIDSVIYVWDTLTGTENLHWKLNILSPALTPTPENHDRLDFSMPKRNTSHDSVSGSSEGVLCCSFSPDGSSFVTGSQNGIVRLWDLTSSSISITLRGHSDQVRCCVFSRCGQKLATASLDSTARVWDVSTGACKTIFHNGEECPVLCCDFSADSLRLITGDIAGSVKVWSVVSGSMVQDLPLHWDHVKSVLYSPKSQNILSAADQGIVKILLNEEIEAESKHMEAATQYHRRFSTVFIKDGNTYQPLILCYTQKEKKLQLIQGTTAEVVLNNIPTLPELDPRCWFFSNCGSKIVVGYYQGKLQMMDLSRCDGKCLVSESWSNDAHDKEVLKCFFSPDNSKLLTCSSSEHKVWTVTSGEYISSMKARGIGAKPGLFLNDSTRVVSIQEKCVLLWDSSSGKELTVFDYNSPGESILCVSLSGDGQKLVASATNGLVVVWDIGGALLMRSDVVPLNACARSCALSPDGSLAVAGFDDGGLKIWNVSSKKEVAQQLTGSQYWMIDVAFSPDGTKIVSLCDSIQWWNFKGQHLKTVLLKGTFGKYIRFSPDFHTFVTIDNAGLLYILTSLHMQ